MKLEQVSNLPSCKVCGRMLRRRQVEELTGLGKSQIYALTKKGDFPVQIAISERAVAWLDHEVQAWIEGRVQASRSNAGGAQ